MRRCRGAGLAGLAAVLLVAVGRAQVQQEPSAETTEGTGINITCSHPNIQTGDLMYWYRQLPGRGPAFLVSALKESKEVPDPPGRLWVAADRRSSALWLARPRRGDAAVYYCALRDTGRGAGAAAGHEPRSRKGGGRGRAQKSPGTVPAAEQESRPERWRCPAVPGQERLQPPAPLAPGEEQRLAAVQGEAGSRDPPAHGQPDSPRSCRRDRPRGHGSAWASLSSH
ncbi:uncharacterized protein LOC129195233 [Grus americana]|uniref:uncharacterized protein LOC129195226 n=1 Tax=Grus americana TaxID=9117 RepID=UPI0024078768|nr:uncharacterized protein LOC129195226 [Grus americana]XP_054657040.1 uncharacterized protein LOC129195233 [Grus americana]